MPPARPWWSARVFARAGRVGVVLSVVAFGEIVCGNYLSLNPRAASSEGRRAVACLSSTSGDGCRWDGWQGLRQIASSSPPPCACAPLQGIGGRSYALARVDGACGAGDGIVAVGAAVYEGMRGDLWLGCRGAAVHCVDRTRVPGLLEQLVRGDADVVEQHSTDPRCDRVGPTPPLPELQRTLREPVETAR